MVWGCAYHGSQVYPRGLASPGTIVWKLGFSKPGSSVSLFPRLTGGRESFGGRMGL